MLVSRIDQVLARTDPYELAQAAERYVSTLSGDRIIALLLNAQRRLGSNYRSEFLRLLDARSGDDLSAALAQPWSDAALRSAFTRFLQSNLRAIPLFGRAFGIAVLARAPGERAVAIGEERANPAMRAAVVAGAALALILAGAAGEHVIVGARAVAQTPEPLVGMPAPTLVPAPLPAPRKPKTPATVIARATVTPATPLPATASPAVTAAPQPSPPQPSLRPRGAMRAPSSQPAPAIVVTAPPQTPAPSPSDLDVSDMPQSYTDATPLPEQTAAPAQAAQHGVKLVTPTPAPKHHGWLHRTVMHLDPFKPHPQPT